MNRATDITSNEAGTGDGASGNVEPSIGATTLMEILEELRILGYAGQLVAQLDGSVRCTACDELSDANDLMVAGFRRIEGASDAADLNLVTWQRCSACGTGASLILGYGPNASAADASVTDGLVLDAAASPGSTPSEG